MFSFAKFYYYVIYFCVVFPPRLTKFILQSFFYNITLGRGTFVRVLWKKSCVYFSGVANVCVMVKFSTALCGFREQKRKSFFYFILIDCSDVKMKANMGCLRILDLIIHSEIPFYM